MGKSCWYQTEEAKRKISEANKGRVRTVEQRQRVSEATKKAMAILPPEVKEKIRAAPLGHQDYWLHHPITEEIKQKMIEAALADSEGRRLRMLGDNNPMSRSEVVEKMRQSLTGRKMPEDIKQKIRETITGTKRSEEFRLNRTGSLNPNWNGGYSIIYPREFHHIREYILKRDDYICQLCGAKAKIAHHIFIDHHRNKEEELVALCRPCNGRLMNKELYEETLQYLIIRAYSGIARRQAREIFDNLYPAGAVAPNYFQK